MKILVVDDHALIREALRGVLKEVKGDAAVLEASDCRQAMQLIAEHADLSLILLDLTLPDRDGFSVLAELRERYPAISVVVLSAVQDRSSIAKALDLGALGFIPKSGQRARGHTSVVRPKHLLIYQENRHKTLATNAFSAPRRRR